VSAEFDRFNSVEMDCSDAVRQSDTVTWWKDGRQLHESASHSMRNSGAVLTLRNVQYDDAGQYECRVVDGETEAVTERHIFILVEAGLCLSITLSLDNIPDCGSSRDRILLWLCVFRKPLRYRPTALRVINTEW